MVRGGGAGRGDPGTAAGRGGMSAAGGRVRFPAGELPVLYEVDAAVIGGTLAGTAAAAALARAGRRVLLVEPGMALGTELTAANRPWLTSASLGGPDVLAPLIPPGTAPGARVPLRPAALKLRLEDAVLAAGGQLLYGVRPLAAHAANAAHGESAVRGLVLAGKSGRRVVRCPLLLDTAAAVSPTGWGAAGDHHRLPAPLAGEGGSAGGACTVWSVEFDGVAERAEAAGAHPAAAGVPLIDGYRDTGHLYALLAVPADGSRRDAVRAACRLLRAHPAFSRAELGAVGTAPLAGPAAFALRADPETAGLWHLDPPPPAAGPYAPLLDPADALRAGTDAATALATRPPPPPPAAIPVSTTAAPGTAGHCPFGHGLTGDGSSGHGQADHARSDHAPIARRAAPVDDVAPRSDAVRPAPDGPPRTGPRPAEPGVAPHRDWRGPAGREFVAAMDVACLPPVDVLVVGGGTSGASAAIAAASAGARTPLVQAGPGPGGTGTYGGVHSYWFGRRAGHAAEIQRATRLTHRELGLRGGVGAWNIEAKALALHRELSRAGADVCYGACAFAALRDGDRVTGAVFAGPRGAFAATASVVVDATGDADLAAWCGAPCTYGAAGVHTVMWYSLAQFDTPAATRNTFGGLCDVTDVVDVTRAVLAARRRGAERHDHGIQPAARETRHLLGETVLTLTDQLTGRRWPDTVAVHFSNHDLKGKGEALWPQVGLIPPNLEIELPYRALLPRGLDGLLVTGKAISATHDALPALRMQADMENLGEVTGIAAARCAATGTAPRDLDVAALQDLLVRRGRLPAYARHATAPERPPPPPPLEDLLEGLAAHLPLHGYSDMGRREVFRGTIPFVHLALDRRPETTPALLRALPAATGQHRLVLAQLLVLRGHPEGVAVLLEHLTERLSGARLPPRDSSIREAQLPPDQSAMPDEAYLLHTLAVARDPRTIPLWERVALLADAREDAFRDPYASPFSWIDAVCSGAERLGDPAAVPALERLHDRPALRHQWRTAGIEPDDVQERRALLELALGRALAACGSPRGYRVLAHYLADNRSLLAAQAHSRLTALTALTALPAHDDPHTADLPGLRVGRQSRPMT
ncbi:FAD-dependent oxidoreductase [Streptomyces sp. 6N223]|uniref:FAD-dependent oxidoreductase n=1 Tax=Streptomyces sp. 6N223 TaxID=3457412 RepID=UPI003FD3E94B